MMGSQTMYKERTVMTKKKSQNYSDIIIKEERQ